MLDVGLILLRKVINGCNKSNGWLFLWWVMAGMWCYFLLCCTYFFWYLQLIKQIPNLSEKNQERPLCFTYSIKARALLHAHLNRFPLNPETLDKDRQYIVKKCPYLIQEMVNCVSQLILLAYARRSKFFCTCGNFKKNWELFLVLFPLTFSLVWQNTPSWSSSSIKGVMCCYILWFQLRITPGYDEVESWNFYLYNKVELCWQSFLGHCQS
jgi:hypothetical protein